MVGIEKVSKALKAIHDTLVANQLQEHGSKTRKSVMRTQVVNM